jgi:exodeoxyribonuclease V beta subunit
MPISLAALLHTDTPPAALRYAARLPQRSLRDSWKITSFTTLAAMSEDIGIPLLPDNGTTPSSLRTLRDSRGQPDQQGKRDDDDILNFPRGAIAGTCLHRLFELADFSHPSGWAAAVTRALHEHPVPADAALTARLPAMMLRLLKNVTSTLLIPDELPHFTLDRISPGRRLTELAFLFPTHPVNLEPLARILSQYGYHDLSATVQTLASNHIALNGYLTGFIDLVFEYDGRFWLLDWKSNFLGEQADDYRPDQLDTAMQTHRYTLQALLYSVALHRYLRHRLAGYDYTRHFGGCLFMFIRAVRPDWHSNGKPLGIWRDRFPQALLDAVEWH